MLFFHAAKLFTSLFFGKKFKAVCVKKRARINALLAEKFARAAAVFARYLHFAYLVFDKKISAVGASAFYLLLFAKIAQNEKNHVPYMLVVI